jgi:ElaB/YqjD/DUF883 family membrane-anchored ribosome-binding protein
MTTQTTNYSDTNAPASRHSSSDGRLDSESGDGMASQLKERMRGMVDSGKARVDEWKGGLQEGIRENPIRSVLIATAVGAVLGLLIGRRSR